MKDDKLDHMTFRKFDLGTIKLDSVICLVGRRRSGKSWMIRQLLYEFSKRGMPYGKIYSGTEHCNPWFSEFFPKLFIEPTVDDDKIRDILNAQAKLVKTVRQRTGATDGRRLSNNMLLVFDDMMSEEDTWKKSKHFNKLFTEGRHYNILFCMAIQYVMGIPPKLRDNIDYAFLFANDGVSLKKLWENYAGVIPTFDMFKAIFHKFTRDRGCMVIDKTNSSGDLRDQVFYFKADDPGPFQFGSRRFWETHEKRYREVDDEEESDEQKLRKLIAMHGSGSQRYHISIES